MRLVGTGEPGGEVPTAFVLKDALGRELDLHVIDVDEQGHVTPLWDGSVSFLPDALQGQGIIADVAVRCLSAAMHMRTHVGYELQEKDIQDLRQLHERLGIEYPVD